MTTHVAVPLTVSEPARRRMGIFTTADLASRGVSEQEIRTAVSSGTWVRLRTGVFITADDLAEVEGPTADPVWTRWPSLRVSAAPPPR